MRKTILVVLLFLIHFGIIAQQSQVRELSIRILTEDKHTAFACDAIDVYLVNDDTIYSKGMSFDDSGLYDFAIKSWIEEHHLYYCIKMGSQPILRINVAKLHKLNDTIYTPKAVIIPINNSIKTRAYDNTEISLLELPKVSNLPTKVLPDFSPEWQMRLYDTVRWFFPTETMLNVDVQKERIYNSYYLQNYYDEFGRYPTEQELDTLAKNMSIGTAEDLIGWYTWNLLRLKEDELCNGSLKDIYRFTMVSNTYFYTYDPYSMRIEPDRNGTAVMYCSYERYDECERKTLYCDIVPLGLEDYSRIQNIVKQMRFWEAKPTESPYDLYKTKKTNILEANINGKYHVIFRGEGEDEGMEELREFLWGLTGLGENKIVHKRQRIE